MRSIFGINDRIAFSEESVLARLQRLKPDKSPGPDGIHPMLLKSCRSIGEATRSYLSSIL